MNDWVAIEEALPEVQEPTDMFIWINGRSHSWTQYKGIPDFPTNTSYWLIPDPPLDVKAKQRPYVKVYSPVVLDEAECQP